jgi:DNA repair photolyase
MSQKFATYADTYAELWGGQPPPSIHFGSSDTDIIRPGRGFVDEFDFTMQTQVGCPAGCLFCYVPAGRNLTPGALRGERWGFEVRGKRDVLAKLEHHLNDGDLADKTVYWSGVTDPYATKAAETRAIWELLNETPGPLRPRRIAVQTRYRPDRDIDLIAQYDEFTLPSDGGPAVVVSYSIGTDRNDLIRAWERATPLFEQRIQAIGNLRRAGVWVVPTLSPFGLWDDLPGALTRFQEWDIPYITCLFFKRATTSSNTPNRFLDYLEREYPLLLSWEWRYDQIRLLRGIYGDDRVLLAKAGFASLTAPQAVIGSAFERLES